jgi:hypothetical protein
MRGAAYSRYSHAQLASHAETFPALREAIGYVAALPRAGALHVCDFGCASGGNAIGTAHHVLDELGDAGVAEDDVSYAFSDLPANDWPELVRELGDGGVTSRTHISLVPRSFYETCFPAASLHLATAYIALHWLSATPCDVGPRGVMAQEHGAPAEALEAWRAHAHADLVAFLKIRAAELVDGGCGLFHMVGGEPPSLWNRLVERGGSVFLEAMDRAVARGELEADAAARATVPYYMRTAAEVRAAAAEVPELEVRAVPSGLIGIGEGQPPATISEIAWAIHGNVLRGSTGMPDSAAAAVRAHLLDVMAERFGPEGCSTNYLAVAVRRRPR